MKRYLVCLYLLAALTLMAACSSAGYAPAPSAAPAPADQVYSEPMAAEAEFTMDETDPPHNTEEYNYIQENPFLSVGANPFSTFAADVDTASYANIRRMLLAGQQPPADAVRIEEMVNYFHYDYPYPEAGQPFSVTTELAPCPWNEEAELMLIGLQAPAVDAEDLPPSNLVFLIDVSGSMVYDNKLPLVKRAFLLLVENLSADDVVSIVTYASSDAVIIEGADGGDRAQLMNAIENLTAGGSTAGSKGIETAYEIAQRYYREGGNNRVILATDGDLNVGITDEGALARLVKEKKKSGVFLSVMGFGTDNIKDNKMEALADNGDGNYSYIDSIAEARKVLIEEMGGTLLTVAKDVKLQVEFNPDVVKGYRLLGYENRLMAAEDFADDTKDGGEIGAGHRVTALYEIVKVDSPFDIAEVPSKYTESKETIGSGEWLTLNIRYKEPEGNTSQLLTFPVDDSCFSSEMSANLSFAAGVAQAGMLLRDSEYAGTSDYEGIKERLEAIPGISDDDYKDEFLYLLGRME